MNPIKEYSQLVISFADRTGYYGFFLLMVLESTSIPILLPAEAILLSAGYLVGVGKLNIYISIFIAVLGTLVGSLINYCIAFFFGRDLLYKYGKFILLNKKRVQRAELLFNENAGLITFLGRFLPFVKHIISLPAGLVKMNIFRFSTFTCLGGGIFSSILLVIGMKIGENIADVSKIKLYTEVGFGLFAMLIVFAFLVYTRYSAKAVNKSQQ